MNNLDYASVFRHGPDCEILFDTNLKIRDITELYIRILNRTRNQVIGKTLPEVFPENVESERINTVIANFRDVIETGKSIKLPTFRYDMSREKEGEMEKRFWTSTTYPIIVEGQVKWIVQRLVDVTKDVLENRISLEVSQRADIFKLIIENVKDYAIFMLDVNGYIRTWNPGAQRLNQYNAEEIIGKHFSIFYPEEDLKTNRQEWNFKSKPDWELAEVKKYGKIEDENWRLRKDGTRFWANVVISALKDEEGDLIGFVKVTRDLTERWLAQQHTILAYEESSKLKAEFLANMSHEIRTPMNGIMSAANLLKDTHLNEEQRELVDILLQSGDSMMKLTNDILDYSKMESDRVYVVFNPFDVHQEIRNTVSNFEKTMTAQVKLHLNISPSVPRWVKGDRLRFHQVLANLVDNAIKFTPSGDIHVDVDAELLHVEVDKKKFRIIVSVKDTGIGISKSDLQKLFSPFSQLEAFATKRYKGTGLGLAICRRLVELMGGDINVESELGVGSKFTFTVNVFGMEDDSAKQVTFQSTEDASRLSETNLAKEAMNKPAAEVCILIAEDNRVNQNVVVRVLKKLGYMRILVAENGQEAVDMYKHNHPDVILMDIQMPVMDGYEATRQIRAMDEHVPIIAMTANALKGDMEKCLAAGMNGYIPKPINIPSLTKMLRGDKQEDI